MNLWEAILLGIAQGLTEFLPISSTAHLRIVPWLAGMPDPGAAFSAILQLGTLGALLCFFHKECLRLIHTTWQLRHKKTWQTTNGKLAAAILIGTLPIGLCGVLFRSWIENEARSLWLIGSMLIGIGLLLALAERFATLRREENSIVIKDGMLIGFAQALALIPGVSRSGSCIAAGLALGLQRHIAARFSFLLGIPALFAAGVFQLWAVRSELTQEAWIYLFAGVISSLLSGYLTIGYFLKFLQSHTNAVFIIYRIALGLLLFGLLAKGILQD